MSSYLSPQFKYIHLQELVRTNYSEHVLIVHSNLQVKPFFASLQNVPNHMILKYVILWVWHVPTE